MNFDIDKWNEDFEKKKKALAKACQPVVRQMQEIGRLIEIINEDPDFQLLVRYLKARERVRNEKAKK